MTHWKGRLPSVLVADLESCEGYGGQVRVIACLEDPTVIVKILQHVNKTGPDSMGGVQLPAQQQGPVLV